MTTTTTTGTIAFTINIDQTVIATTEALVAQRVAENIRVGVVTHVWTTIA